VSGRREFGDFTLLIAAAGQGTRLGRGPKAFLRLGEKSLLEWVVSTGQIHFRNIRLAVPSGLVEAAKRELIAFPQVDIVEGGETRQDTFQILAEGCESEFIIIRDVSRPLVSSTTMEQVALAAIEHGAAGAFHRLQTPIAIRQGNYVCDARPRADILAPSNPQAYKTDLLRRALCRASDDGAQLQTLWELVLQQGTRLFIVDEKEPNQKITYPSDWEVVEKILFPAWLTLHQDEIKER